MQSIQWFNSRSKCIAFAGPQGPPGGAGRPGTCNDATPTLFFLPVVLNQLCGIFSMTSNMTSNKVVKNGPPKDLMDQAFKKRLKIVFKCLYILIVIICDIL